MKGKLFAAAAAVFLFCGISHAVDVGDYNAFQTALSSGSNINITAAKDIIKASTYAVTIVPAASNFTITGNNKIIDLNRNGNMMTLSNTNTNIAMSSFTLIRGNYSQEGGAIHATANSQLSVNGTANFKENYSALTGGAIFVTNSARVVFTGDTNFDLNSAAGNGGAISLTTNKTLADFSGTNLYATNNRSMSGHGGFLSAVNAGTIVFGSSTFVNNSADRVSKVGGFGGVIYSSGSSVLSFTKDVNFSNNSAHSAGAVFLINGSSATFSGDNTLFQGNESADAVGALLVRSSASVVFIGQNTVFRNNFMTNNSFGTGAVDVAYGAYADFRGTNLTAQNNNAGTDGWGGFLWAESSIVLIGNALIGGTSASHGNHAYYGGGIHAGEDNNMTFSGVATFGSNRAQIDGGGMFVSTRSVVTFTNASSTTFQNNTASGKGGAMALKEGASVLFDGGDINFNFNNSAYGGAVSIDNGSTLDIINGHFTANSASREGGAVYLRGTGITNASVLLSKTVNTGDGRTVFRGNTAGGVRNAIYMDDYSRAVFDIAANTSVEMFDGISGSTNYTTYFEVSGAGNFNLHSTFDVLDLNNLGRFNLKDGAVMNASTVNNTANAIFSMQNDVNDTANMKALNNVGKIVMDASGSAHDKIIVSGALTLNNTLSVLEVNSADMADTKYRKKIYKLINYETYTGSFSAVNIVAPVQPVSYYVGYGNAYPNWLTLAMVGSQSTTEFSKIKGETFNQKEAAKALDKISGKVVTNDPWDLALAEIESYNDDTIKNILTHLAGYFLPNVIRNAAADSPNNEIYDKIKNHCVEGHMISNGVWVQARAGVESFYENDNSPEDYKDTSVGIMAGYDRYMDDKNLMLGIYGRFNSDSIEQGKNKADGTKTGAGIYAGYIKEDWELKGLTLLSFDSFDVKRYVNYIDATAKSDIKTTTLSFDIEGALKFDMSFYTKFRPYAGFEFANASYKGFTESGAGLFNLDVEGGNYLRTAGRVGAGLHYEEDIWSLYGNVEGKILFSGTEPEIENVFEGTNASFKTRGAKEGSLEFGLGLGGAVRLTQSLKVFINANYYGADKYQNIFGNVGLRYTFCNPFSYAKPSEPAQPAQEYEDPVKYIEPEPEPVVKSEDIDMTNEAVVEAQKLEAQKRREKPMLKSYSLNMASFDVGKSNLKAAAKEDIAKEAEEIKRFDYKRIIIEGHTDSTGSNNLNKELSKARAKAVFDEFAAHGIPEEKMLYIGFGPSMPKDTNKTAEGRANNRRVEIFVE